MQANEWRRDFQFDTLSDYIKCLLMFGFPGEVQDGIAWCSVKFGEFH